MNKLLFDVMNFVLMVFGFCVFEFKFSVEIADYLGHLQFCLKSPFYFSDIQEKLINHRNPETITCLISTHIHSNNPE
jgi:hypothetical protein